jgi:hypothetical protein
VALASTAPVTAQRVRNGEPAALSALVDRRGGAVLAYCEEVAAPGDGAAAAGEAFARFRREVVAAEEPRLLDPEAVLLRGTRQAAAAAATRTVPPRGLLARRLGSTCVLVPELLAARAEGTLTTADRLRLSRHLERCAGCRESEERFAAGERAYQDAPSTPPPPELAERLLAALRDAAPNAELAAAAASNGSPPPPLIDQAPAEERDTPTLSWDAADVAAAAPDRRGLSWFATRLIVPAVVFAVAFVIALAVAGVFGDDNADVSGSIETQSADPPAQIRVHARPVTTPLPEATTGSVALPAPSDQNGSPGGTTTFAAASSQAAPVARPSEPEPKLSAQARRRSEAAAPPPEQSAPATTGQAFQPSPSPQPPAAP